MTELNTPLNLIDLKIRDAEIQIDVLTHNLAQAKAEVLRWVESNASVSSSAQLARAETQSMGRGVGGLLLGSKYRNSRRQFANHLNANLARDVAERKSQIRDGKNSAQNVVRAISDQIKAIKDDLKLLKSQKKEILNESRKSLQTLKLSTETMKVLEKLHDLYNLGILNQEEYESKRQAIISKI